MRLIEIDGKKIKLSSGLTEEEFAKTRFASLITEKGVVVQADLPSENIPTEDFDPNFLLSDWTFESIKSQPDEDGNNIVFYEGSFDFLPDDAKKPVALADLWEDKAFNHVKAATLICAAITYAATNMQHLPLNGGGILISHAESKIFMIFLPEKIFFNSVPAADEKALSRYIGFYRIPLLAYQTSLHFMQAVITYKALTGQFPFAKEDGDERMADIMDKNFLPVEYAVEGIDPEFTDVINKAVSQRAGNAQDDYADLHQKLYVALLKSAAKAKNSEAQDKETFLKRAEEYQKSRSAQVERKRKLKKNSAKIIAAGATLAVLLMFVFSAINSNANQPTTIGLSATQVTECFFQSINKKDIQLMTAVTKGSAFKPYISAVTNMHVANAASQAYTFNSVNVEPEKWFFYATDPVSDSKTSLYGITNLKINGYNSVLNAKTTKKKEKPEPVLPAAQKNITETLPVSYYIVQVNPDDGSIETELTEGSVTLTYLKNRWVLTGIKVTAMVIPFSTQEFKSDYYAALKAADGNVITATQSLALRYPWVPSRAVMEAEERELKEGF